MTPCLVSCRRASAALAAFSALFLITSPRAAAAQTPAGGGGGAFDRGIVVGGEWQQASALPLGRDALESMAAGVALRRSRWAIDAGWLRIARTLSTVQGGYVSLGVPLSLGRLLIVPSVGGFGGQAQRSVDSTGFDWVDASGNTGHTARYSFSKAGSAGGGAGLTLELPLYRMVAIRASGAEWYFSGAPLDGDRARTTVGVGLSIRLDRLAGGSR